MSLRDQLRVLVVDDMSTSRGLIIQALESFGVRNISSAENGIAAIQQIAQSPAHMVISDYNMPGMDGLHLLKALRQNSKTQRVAFILITGRAEKEIIDFGKKLGMNNYLKKPFTPDELKRAMEAIVGAL